MTTTKPPLSVNQGVMFALHLLDPTQGHALIKWKFSPQPVIRIGRSEQNEVAVSDPSVSRNHAELHWTGDHWKLVNLGRNGTVVDGSQVTDVRIDHGARFRLGPTGPMLQLTLSDSLSAAMGTVAGPEPEELPCIEIDHTQKERQVAEIAESSYFKQLQQRAKQLKNRVDTTETLPK